MNLLHLQLNSSTLLLAGDMSEADVARAVHCTLWRVRAVRRELEGAAVSGLQRPTGEPAGIARVRAEVARLEAELAARPDPKRQLLLEAKRRTLAVLERTAAYLGRTPPAA